MYYVSNGVRQCNSMIFSDNFCKADWLSFQQAQVLGYLAAGWWPVKLARKMEVACNTITRLRDKARDLGEEQARSWTEAKSQPGKCPENHQADQEEALPFSSKNQGHPLPPSRPPEHKDDPEISGQSWAQSSQSCNETSPHTANDG